MFFKHCWMLVPGSGWGISKWVRERMNEWGVAVSGQRTPRSSCVSLERLSCRLRAGKRLSGFESRVWFSIPLESRGHPPEIWDSSGSKEKLLFNTGGVFVVLPASFLGGFRPLPPSSTSDPPAPQTPHGLCPVSPLCCVGFILASSKHAYLEAMFACRWLII